MLAILLFPLLSGIAVTSGSDGPEFTVLGDAHLNLGQCETGEVLRFEWEFQNTGKAPLEVSYRANGYYCQTPFTEFSETQIAPGAKATFRQCHYPKRGKFIKSYEIRTNTPDSIVRLSISGEAE